MHALLLAATLLIITPTTAHAADEDVHLATVTCGATRADGTRVNPRMIAAAFAGRAAAKAGHARLSADFIKTIGETITRGCEGPEAADRKLADVIAGIAVSPNTDADRDFATLTCAQLAPLWKEEARQIVPFLVGRRDAAANTPITRAGLDKVGQGLPKLCREPGNETKLVTDLAKDLK